MPAVFFSWLNVKVKTNVTTFHSQGREGKSWRDALFIREFIFMPHSDPSRHLVITELTKQMALEHRRKPVRRTGRVESTELGMGVKICKSSNKNFWSARVKD